MTKRSDQGKPFDTEYFRDYYDQYRSSVEDLFPSERHFLPEFAIANQSYLDIGCARGGMYDIITECAAPIEYTGIDISSSLSSRSRRRRVPAVVVAGSSGASYVLRHHATLRCALRFLNWCSNPLHQS